MTDERATSRPLRALWLVVGLWISGRSAAIWYALPTSELSTSPSPNRSTPLIANAHGEGIIQRRASVDAMFPRPAALLLVAQSPQPTRLALPQIAMRIPSLDVELNDADSGTDPERMVAVWVKPVASTASATSPSPRAAAFARLSPAVEPHSDRWSASTWFLARSGASPALASGGQLGGSQIGGRADYALTHGVFLTSRISSPLRAQGGREATIGIGVRRKAFGAIVEQRIALDGSAHSRSSATVYGGFSEAALPANFRLDAYGQAGLVSRDAFADGALRVEHSIVERGSARLSVGAGVWGAAQPGVARVDIGPQVVARVPFAGRLFRASAEWRQRVAGNANPGSGPTFTLGADF